MGSIITKIRKEIGPPAGDIKLDLIFQAARTGDCTLLGRLLEGGSNVNACDPWDASPLYYACHRGHGKAAPMLLEAGADYSKSTIEGERCYRAALNLGIRRLLREYETAPLAPLPAALRSAFLACHTNRAGAGSGPTDAAGAPDITVYVEGKRIGAHRVILAARSPLFRRNLTTVWRNKKELTVTLCGYSVSFEAWYGLLHFFYTDRVEVPGEDIQDLARLCQICECEGLLEMINRLFPCKRLDRIAAGTSQLDREENPQRRVVLQRRFAQDRLPSALRRILQDCLANSREEDLHSNSEYDDLADICIKVGDRVFRCHQMILAQRSEYFRTRLSRRPDFLERRHGVLEEHDVSAEAFEKMLEYVYTDELEDLGDECDDPLEQAEQLLDVASRYLLFPLKRAVADLLLPHLDLDRVSPAQICRWLMLSDMHDVAIVREHCLGIIARNFKAFAKAREFRALLLMTQQTSAPADDLLFNDLRERWLGVAVARLCRRGNSAELLDKRMERPMLTKSDFLACRVC
ncbi:unnamed protein product [Alopecurus aequalis]